MTYKYISMPKKYNNLLEGAPFGKIAKNHGNDDADNMSKLHTATTRISKNAIIEEFKKLYTKDIFEQYHTAKIDYIQLLTKAIGASNIADEMIYESSYLNYILKTAATGYISNDNERAELCDIDVSIMSGYIEVILPCFINSYRELNLMFIEGQSVLTPYSLYNGLYEFIFNSAKYGYTQILKQFGMDLPVKVKFKIINENEYFGYYNQYPTMCCCFLNYQDTSYMQDFTKYFTDMFINITAHNMGTGSLLRAYFINCFNNSTDLSEINALYSSSGGSYSFTGVRLINVTAAYIDNINNTFFCNKIKLFCSDALMTIGIHRDNCGFVMPSKTDPIHNMTSIDDGLIRRLNTFNLVVYPNNTYTNKGKKNDRMKSLGFSNKLINYVDSKIAPMSGDKKANSYETQYAVNYVYLNYISNAILSYEDAKKNADVAAVQSRKSPINECVNLIKIESADKSIKYNFDDDYIMVDY